MENNTCTKCLQKDRQIAELSVKVNSLNDTIKELKFEIRNLKKKIGHKMETGSVGSSGSARSYEMLETNR